MKRIVKASRYTEKIDKNLVKIGKLASMLSEIAYSTTDDEMMDALSQMGSMFSGVSSKKQAIHNITDLLTDVVSDYLIAAKSESSLPRVRDSLIEFLNSKYGFPMDRIGSSDSYLIMPAGTARDVDLKLIARAVAHEFGIQPDTGIIGGSWTRYDFVLNGVRFSIGFDMDDDLVLSF